MHYICIPPPDIRQVPLRRTFSTNVQALSKSEASCRGTMYRSSYLRAVAKSLKVGISAEFPSGTLSETNFDHKSFFEFLLKGQDAYERVPKDRFNIDGLRDQTLFSTPHCHVHTVQLDGKGLTSVRYCPRKRASSRIFTCLIISSSESPRRMPSPWALPRGSSLNMPFSRYSTRESTRAPRTSERTHPASHLIS